jgi:hypothetical protein
MNPLRERGAMWVINPPQKGQKNIFFNIVFKGVVYDDVKF